MIPGLHGPLLSHDFAERVLPVAFAGRLGEADRDRAASRLATWWRQVSSSLGPASSVRALFDRGAAPLASLFGFRAGGVRLAADDGPGLATLCSDAGAAAGLVVVPWGADLGRVWSVAVREGIRDRARWCFCFSGPRLRLVDAERTYARRFVEIDLETAAEHPAAFAIAWSLLRERAFVPTGGTARALLDEIVEASDAHGAGVRRSLQSGVQAALVQLVGALATAGLESTAGETVPSEALFEGSLTIIYRILFLLFAEARGLVPTWHPVYRDGYSMAALQAHAEATSRPRGLWDALEAVTRLAHAGCEAGDLRVTPFNGRLFAPDRSPLNRRSRGRRRAVERDASLGRVLLALTTRPAGTAGRERISYGDLGVEQLGAVYERVLDYEPVIEGRPTAASAAALPAVSTLGRRDAPAIVSLRATGRRKATGTFYTPRSLTDFLVRRTLHPLVRDAPPEAVLQLRILDAAMGSGAFLVSACRYLAAAYERALVRQGTLAGDDVTDADRAAFRRLVAQRCLYGVDVNPMAVQLSRLSLWLATLAADKPLTFLDHHLRVGNSLVGASMEDVMRRPPPRSSPKRASASLPLFDTPELAAAVSETWHPRARLALDPDDTPRVVRLKERLLDRIEGPDAPLARWRAVADLWCAAWFWPELPAAPRAGEFWALADLLVRGHSALPPHVARARLDEAHRVAVAHGFFHWTLEFPEVFFEADGRVRERPGFDAIIGNPPWEMLRADDGNGSGQRRSRDSTPQLVRFARDSRVYALQGSGHPNLYQLFLERALALIRRGGRVGLVLPGGLLTDHGSTTLREHLLARCDTDTIVAFDNREAIFPIHRSYRFLLLTATSGISTTGVRCRFGERRADILDALPDAVADQPPAAFPVTLTPALVRRLSGDSLAIPELKSMLDVAIAEKAAATARPLSHPEGWHARFGRELNATDDRPHLAGPGRGLPVIEGKHIEPFHVASGAARFSIAPQAAARLLDRATTFGRPRLAYRDVASATNRLTLIAAIVPADAVTTHTVFCLKSDLGLRAQRCLCGLLNSYVANYLVRQRVSTHVTAATLERVPVPRPRDDSPEFVRLARLASRLEADPRDEAAGAQLQAVAAHLYGLTRDEFAHVVSTFPLVDAAARRAAVVEFENGR
jgi:hypothetical protein